MSISVPPEVANTIKIAAAREGKPVSAWLAEAAVQQAEAAAKQAESRAAALEMVADYEKEHGPLPEEDRRWTRDFLRELGLVVPEPQPAAGT